MTTTTQVTTITLLNIEDIDWDGHEAAYDMDAIRSDYRDAIQALLPAGVTLALNGMVFADVEVADEAREIDWSQFEDTTAFGQSVDFWAIAANHVVDDEA